jgi:hypothetical protein
LSGCVYGHVFPWCSSYGLARIETLQVQWINPNQQYLSTMFYYQIITIESTFDTSTENLKNLSSLLGHASVRKISAGRCPLQQ